ncbi:MAG: hypothetical protein AAF360_13420 [Pseudomonadota bacterium]
MRGRGPNASALLVCIRRILDAWSRYLDCGGDRAVQVLRRLLGRDGRRRIDDGADDVSVAALISLLRTFQDGAAALLASGDAKGADARIWADTADQIRLYLAELTDLFAATSDISPISIGRQSVLRALRELEQRMSRIVTDSLGVAFGAPARAAATH